jgi:hypothetical protein
VETIGRDDMGRFEGTYNERYRKGPDDAVGPGFLSIKCYRAG